MLGAPAHGTGRQHAAKHFQPVVKVIFLGIARQFFRKTDNVMVEIDLQEVDEFLGFGQFLSRIAEYIFHIWNPITKVDR